MTVCKKRRGFNLIESAIVLGVVGLVIGGIWYAAASVIQSQRINNTAAGIIQIASAARRLFSYNDYPTVSATYTNVITTLNAASLLPGDFKYDPSLGIEVSPLGAEIAISLDCWGAVGSSQCPMLAIYFPMVAHPSHSSTLTLADCIQLIRRFAGLAKDRNDFLYVQRDSTSSGALMLYPPINPALVTCPADTTYITFWFKP